MSASSIPVPDPQPRPPEKPLACDCCGGGCDPCVYDSYADEMDAYKLELNAWNERHAEAEPKDKT